MKVMTNRAYKLFHDGVKALSKVEANGIRIDVPYLNKTMDDTAAQLRDLERGLKKTDTWQRWVKRFGAKANFGSAEQLGKVLFDPKAQGGYGFECLSRTATGRPKVDEAAIEQVDLPFCREYSQWKRLYKARNTFLTGIRRELVGEFIHPNYNLHLMLSYRSSCDSPNLQNTPVRNKALLTLIRRCYIPRPGHVLAEIDFSGIEVRVAACYCKDPALIEYIEDKTTDMHRDAACRLFFLEPGQVSKAVRHTAKNKFVFPQFYGSYYVDCAKAMWEEVVRQKSTLEGSSTTVVEHLAKQGIQSLGRCDPDSRPVKDTFEYQVKQTEDWFWNRRFKVYTEWKKAWWANYLRRGYFRSYTGFVYQGVFRRNQVLNLMIQGSAFHCLLWSLTKLQAWLDKHKMRSKIVNEVHDSIWIDAHEDELQDVLNKAYEIMTARLVKAWPWIIVPVETETEVAPAGKSIADKQVWVPNAGLWSLKA